MKWVTRERAKVDRIACPWLIKKFVDKNPEFLFVPPEKIPQVVKETGAIPYDAKGIELTHYKEDGKEYVSFDAIIKKYKLKDPALLELAKIVRGADAKIPDAPAESAGLEAVAHGFRNLARDDLDNMRLQFPTYDALYKFCQLKVEGVQKLEYNVSQSTRYGFGIAVRPLGYFELPQYQGRGGFDHAAGERTPCSRLSSDPLFSFQGNDPLFARG